MRKRIVVTAAIAALLTAGAMAGHQEVAATRLPDSRAVVAQEANRESPRERQCRFQWVDRGTWTAREERLTAECVVAKYPVPGGLAQLIAVGDCESGWWRFSYNPNGHAGLFQHDVDAWPDRVRTWEPYWWDLDPRWTNSRTQIVVTARMARGDGDWHQWSGCS